MLKLDVPARELFNEETGEFIYTKSQTLTMEHSLLAISKWESKWHKPFLNSDNKSQDEERDYVRCMTITPNVDPNVYFALGPTEFQKIRDYINDPYTATTVHRTQKKPRNNSVITAEIIYYWMFSLDIPYEFEKRNLNWLLMLIEVCDIKGGNGGNMSKKDIVNQYKNLNDIRRAKYHTKG